MRFCAKAALLAKRAATCDKVEISDNFDGCMSQQYCEWISDKVDERELSNKSSIPCSDHQEFANMVAAVYAQISPQNQPQNCTQTSSKGRCTGQEEQARPTIHGVLQLDQEGFHFGACGPVIFNVFKLHVPGFGHQSSLLMSVLLPMSTLCWCTTISASNPLRMVYTCIMQVVARKQHPCPSNPRRWFRQFLVIYCCLDKRGGGRGYEPFGCAFR